MLQRVADEGMLGFTLAQQRPRDCIPLSLKHSQQIAKYPHCHQNHHLEDTCVCGCGFELGYENSDNLIVRKLPCCGKVALEECFETHFSKCPVCPSCGYFGGCG